MSHGWLQKPLTQWPTFQHLSSPVLIRHTHPRPGVSQVESLRFRVSELRGSMEFSPNPLIVYT